jgi:hypothetical protein
VNPKKNYVYEYVSVTLSEGKTEAEHKDSEYAL